MCVDDYVQVLIKLHELKEAKSMNEYSLALKKKCFFPIDRGIEFCFYYANAGHIHFFKKEYEKSVACYRTALEKLEGKGANGTPMVVYEIMSNLAMCLEKLNRIDESIAMAEAIRQYNKIYKAAKFEKSIYILSNILRLKLKHHPFDRRALKEDFR